MAMLMTEAVRYVISRDLVLGISALRICAVGAQPREYPNVEITIIATIPALMLLDGETTVPSPPIVMSAETWNPAPTSN